MHIGFTGTQLGMNDRQIEELGALLMHLKNEDILDEELTVFHHGDCIGADAEAHAIAKGLGLLICVHPPTVSTKRAYCVGEVLVPRPYLERNKNIVDACDVLFVAPKGNVEELRSGTWATYRYAMKLHKTVLMLER